MTTYHFIVGGPGTGTGSIVSELLPVLRQKNGRADSVQTILWGKYKNWRPNATYRPGIFFENFSEKRLANPNVTDWIIHGPGLVINFERILETLTPNVQYFVKRNSEEYTNKTATRMLRKNEFFKNVPEDKKQVVKNRWKAATDNALILVNNATDALNLDWVPFRSFYLDTEDQTGSPIVTILPAQQTTLSYLRQVAIKS